MQLTDNWHNLSIRLSQNVIARPFREIGQVTIPLNHAENVEFVSRRSSDFRHLGLWHSECDSTGELVIQPNC
jgi:hypothetical protein